jgi:hypothetical protein
MRQESAEEIGFTKRLGQMDDKPYKTIFVARPTDRSLEAYKVWIRELAQKLQSNGEVKWAEDEWIANWKKFWKENLASEST